MAISLGSLENHAGSLRPGRACLTIVLLITIQAQADTAPNHPPNNESTQAVSLFVPSVLKRTQPIVGSITIQNDNVFDVETPEEDGFFYRLVNKAHIKTRPNVIYEQLLFTEGEELTKDAVDETERILRSNRYIQDASIETNRQSNGTVDVIVNTIDSWTLVPKISLSRSGGENSSGIGIKEMNLLGTGMEVEALYRSNVDRDAIILKFLDRNLFDSWYRLAAVYADNSDGHTRLFDLAMPFYSLHSNRAHGFSVFDNDQVHSMYENGEIVDQYRHEAQSFKAFRGWSKGLVDGWTKRLTVGLGYDDHQFSELGDDTGPGGLLPGNRTLVYPFVGFEFIENRFEKTRNLEQINRTEDRFLGTQVSAKLGYAASVFGSDRDAWIIEADARMGFGTTKKNSLFLSSSIATRVEDDGLQNAMLNVGARYYRRQSERRLFFASIGATFGHNLDIDNQILLGGDSGLRGYPLRYRSGDKSALLTLEQRYFTDWYPFRLFRVGGAVFFDAGKTWNSRYPSLQEGELLRNVGFGLRLTNARSGQNRMTHIDVAFPLDGDYSIKDVQFLIETRKSF